MAEVIVLSKEQSIESLEKGNITPSMQVNKKPSYELSMTHINPNASFVKEAPFKKKIEFK
jgi:outer membrane protein assembly factor BamA